LFLSFSGKSGVYFSVYFYRRMHHENYSTGELKKIKINLVLTKKIAIFTSFLGIYTASKRLFEERLEHFRFYYSIDRVSFIFTCYKYYV
jgi:hypothetical protein